MLLSCSKEKEDINHQPVADFTYTDELDQITLHDKSTDPDGDILEISWISTNDSINIANPYISTTFFNIPALKDTSHLKVGLTVSDGLLTNTIYKNVPLPPLTQVRIYGLGRELHYSYSNNVNYNWYYDQMNSGSYASVNCGPASVTMAIKWADKNFSKTPEDARNTYRTDGGWWYTNDIINYLNIYSVNNYTIDVDQIDIIRTQLDQGNIVILCLDMYYVRKELKQNWHVDKFYSASTLGWGHFIVIKGYEIVDNEILYEAYDPYSFGMTYPTDSLKGINRYYRSEDLNSAVINWWKYAIIVTRNELKGTGTGVDINKIIHKSGQ